MDGYITRVADEIADILLREGIDYVQSKAVFTAVRSKAGLCAPKERRAAPARLTLEEHRRAGWRQSRALLISRVISALVENRPMKSLANSRTPP